MGARYPRAPSGEWRQHPPGAWDPVLPSAPSPDLLLRNGCPPRKGGRIWEGIHNAPGALLPDARSSPGPPDPGWSPTPHRAGLHLEAQRGPQSYTARVYTAGTTGVYIFRPSCPA